MGVKTVHNEYRNIDEPIIQYILRHTRLLPRDIVIIGNQLADIKRLMTTNPEIDVVCSIRKIVAECAKTFGNELLQICANQINNNEMPKGAATKGYSEVYTSVQEYKEQTSQLIKQVLMIINTDKLSWERICELDNRSKKIIGENCKMLDVLWQNGAIGYIEEGPNGKREVFFNQEFPEFLLPKMKKIYILRSCLIDAVGIENTCWDSEPVLGGNFH